MCLCFPRAPIRNGWGFFMPKKKLQPCNFIMTGPSHTLFDMIGDIGDIRYFRDIGYEWFKNYDRPKPFIILTSDADQGEKNNFKKK